MVVLGYPVRLRRWLLLTSVLMVRVHGPLLAYGGVWRPEHSGPMFWRQQVVPGLLVSTVKVCLSRVASGHWWVW